MKYAGPNNRLTLKFIAHITNLVSLVPLFSFNQGSILALFCKLTKDMQAILKDRFLVLLMRIFSLIAIFQTVQTSLFFQIFLYNHTNLLKLHSKHMFSTRPYNLSNHHLLVLKSPNLSLGPNNNRLMLEFKAHYNIV